MTIPSSVSAPASVSQRQLADAAAGVLEPNSPPPGSPAIDKLLAVYDALLDRYMPSLILIDAARRVVDTFCGADQFLRFSSRRPSEDVLDLLIPPLREPVREAFLHCCSTGQAVVTQPQWVRIAADQSPGGLIDWLVGNAAVSSVPFNPPSTTASSTTASSPATTPPNADLPTTRQSDGSMLCPIQVRITPVTQSRDDELFFSLAFETATASQPHVAYHPHPRCQTVRETRPESQPVYSPNTPLPPTASLPPPANRFSSPDSSALLELSAATAAGQAEAFYLTAAQHSAIGITQCDPQGRYLLANQRFCSMVGYPMEMLADLTFSDLTHPEDLPHELTLRQQLLDGEIETYHLEKRYLHRSGQEVWASLFVSLERDDVGLPAKFHAYVEDISSQKALENDLRQAIRQRDQFLAILSHELRNPLGAIINSCAVLERHRLQVSHLDQAVAVVNRQAKQMAELLDDLLDVSRITAGKIKLDKTPLQLAAIVDEAIESQQSLAAARGQRLTVTFCDDPLHVFGDRSRLVQIVVNLLNNAIKYTGEGGTITVSLDKDPQGRHGRISVTDTGVGLEPRQIESLFEMFAQQDATLDRSGGGMGLGLHLVRRLVDFHSGRVYGRSPGLGHGSEFTVELPLSTRPRQARRSGRLPPAWSPIPTKAAPPTPNTDPATTAPTTPHQQIVVDDPRRPAQPTSNHAPPSDLPPSDLPPSDLTGGDRTASDISASRSKRIVVVEDMDDARRMLVALLKADGYQVWAAADGQAGLELILQQRPDLAIVDIGLPQLDGYEVARRVRQQLKRDPAGPTQPRRQPMQLVALTGYGQESDHAAVLQAGFDAHLVKPLSPSRLEKILAGLS